MNQIATATPSASDIESPRSQLRTIFRLAIAAAAAVTTYSLAQSVPGASPANPASRGVGSTPLNAVVVPITDTIAGKGENIRFDGQANINSLLIDDLLTKSPRVLEIIIDFSGVTAIGVTSGKRYITTAQSILHRPAKPFDIIEVSFPYYVSGDLGSARVAMAAFSVGLSAGVLNITSKLTTPA